MTKEEANKVIAEKLEQAYALIRECEAIADETGVGFSWDLAYGMGGWYHTNDSKARAEFKEGLIVKFMADGMTREEAIERIEDEELVENEFDWESSDYGWQSSSASC